MKHLKKVSGIMGAIGVYIKSDFLSQMSKNETIILFQLFRITNSLEFWIRMHDIIPKEQNDLFDFRNRIELYFAMICSYKESTKEFGRNLAEDLLNMNLSQQLSLKISEYNTWLENWKQDEYLQVVDRIRNDLRFHICSSIYDKCLKDGNESKDLMVGVAFGKQHRDFLYTEPYTFEFSHIAEIVPVSIKEDAMNWIQKRSAEETIKLVKLLREIIREILKGHTYKKHVDM